jgi:hypothetical protein
MLARIISGEGVEVAYLRTVGAGDTNNVMLGNFKGPACFFRHVEFLEQIAGSGVLADLGVVMKLSL